MLRKNASSASSWNTAYSSRLSVPRLRFSTCIRCSIAHLMPAASTDPFPDRRPPSTRTLYSSASGATARMMAAQAVPWPNRSSCSPSTILTPPGSVGSASMTTPPWIPLTSGWPLSIPLSRIATRTPRPELPPHAHSLVISEPRVTGWMIARRSSSNLSDHAGRTVASALPGPRQENFKQLDGRVPVFRRDPAELVEAGGQPGQAGRWLAGGPGDSFQGRREVPGFAPLGQGGEERVAEVGEDLGRLDGQRRLSSEQAEQLEVAGMAAVLPTGVEDLHDPDQFPLGLERHGEDRGGHVSRLFGHVAGEPRIGAHVGHGDRLA